MKNKNTKLQVNQKRTLAPKNIDELKTKIKKLLGKPIYGIEAQIDKRIAKNKSSKDDVTEQDINIASLFNLDNFYSLRELVSNWDKGRAAEFGIQLYKEYNCQTASEKALAQTVVIAFEHVLDLSRRLHIMMENTSVQVMDIKTYPFLLKRMQIIGLELDRANRQFLTALQTLKQIKAPQIEVNVKTKTAFVAQNQQFNVGNKSAEGKEDEPNEIIEAK